MTRDDVLNMAVTSGLYSNNPRTPFTGNIVVRRLEKFAELVAAHERKACARLCDPELGIKYSPNTESARKRCAAAIRSRGES